MKTITALNKIPEASIIASGFGQISYFDSYRIVSPTTDSVDKITTAIFDAPQWVNLLMVMRNAAVRIFGIKAGGNEQPEKKTYYPVGSKVMYFRVIDRNENEIVLGENDKHLNFRVSVLVDRAASIIDLTTIVHFNNIWGKAYFLPVKPFHKLIVRSLLKRRLESA